MEGGSDHHAHVTDKTGTHGWAPEQRPSPGGAGGGAPGPVPSAGSPSPRRSRGGPTLEPPATHTVTWAPGVGRGRGQTVGLKIKNRTKTKKVMQRGEKSSVFFPSGQISSELAARMVTNVSAAGLSPPPGLPTSSTVPPFICLALSPASRQRYTGTSGPAEGGLFFNLWTQRTLPPARGDSRRPPATWPPLQASRTHPAGEGISGATH